MRDLSSKVALITGCSSGIGKQTSLEFARNGIYTFASMRDVSKGVDLERAAKNEGLPLKIIELDVTKPITVKNAFKQVLAEKNKLDILVNNAGFMIMGSFEDIDVDHFNAQWRTDFLGPIIMMKEAIPIMRKQNVDEDGIKGNIINVSSIAGKISFAYASAYVASKFALEGLSECVSDEISNQGIKINIVEPGVVKTRFLDNTDVIVKENSPYRETVDQWNIMAKKLFEVTQNVPADVADAIIHCIKDPEADLRIPVGEDAKLFLDMHTQFSNEPSRFKTWFEGEMEKMFKAIE